MVEPPPAQQPHPPFWVAAGSEASIRRAAQRGFNLILDQYASPEQLGQRIALYRAEREASGRRFDPMQVAVARQLYVAKDQAEAEAALKRAAQYTKRTVDVSRAPGGKAGSHVLSYAGDARRHRGECALRHAGRDLREARSAPQAPASNMSC